MTTPQQGPIPDSLFRAIQDLHQAIADHQDPQAKATLATCLQNMLKVQAQDHQTAQQGGPQQSLLSRVGGGPNG